MLMFNKVSKTFLYLFVVVVHLRLGLQEELDEFDESALDGRHQAGHIVRESVELIDLFDTCRTIIHSLFRVIDKVLMKREL